MQFSWFDECQNAWHVHVVFVVAISHFVFDEFYNE